jgi:hypothetical protein
MSGNINIDTIKCEAYLRRISGLGPEVNHGFVFQLGGLDFFYIVGYLRLQWVAEMSEMLVELEFHCQSSEELVGDHSHLRDI